MNLKLCRWILGTCVILASAWPVCTALGQPGREQRRRLPPEQLEYELAKVTTERRAAGKLDPITILINNEKELVGSPIFLPSVEISLKNVDVEKKNFQIQPLDDYRSGRLPKFRIVIKDEMDKELPPRPRFSAHGGGIIHAIQLAPDDKWETALNLRGYVEPLLPGKYSLQVLFSDREAIAGMKDTSKVVCCQSKTIEFVVHKLPAKISNVDKVVVREQIAALDGDQPLRIVSGTYGPWAYGFIAKNSPAGQLMAIGPTAVPQLVEAVQDKELKTGKRAWLLGILYSITGREDPRGEDEWHLGGCLESYEYAEGPWSLAAGKNDEQQPVSFTLPSTGSREGKKEHDPKKVDEHAARWPAWVKANCDPDAAPK